MIKWLAQSVCANTTVTAIPGLFHIYNEAWIEGQFDGILTQKMPPRHHLDALTSWIILSDDNIVAHTSSCFFQQTEPEGHDCQKILSSGLSASFSLECSGAANDTEKGRNSNAGYQLPCRVRVVCRSGSTRWI